MSVETLDPLYISVLDYKEWNKVGSDEDPTIKTQSPNERLDTLS